MLHYLFVNFLIKGHWIQSFTVMEVYFGEIIGGPGLRTWWCSYFQFYL